MDRDALQQKAAERLKLNKRLVCMWATGTGKSGVVLKFLKENPTYRTLILVPETNNIENWIGEFDKFGVSMLNVEVICYASLHKYINSQWDLLVIDEAPHSNTALKIEQLSTVSAEYVLALGAVISEEELLTLERLYGKFVIWRIGLEMAIKNGILPPPTIKVLHMNLDDTKKKFRLDGMAYTAKEMYDVLHSRVSAAVNEFNLRATQQNKMKMQRAGLMRKRFLGARKDEAIKTVCNRLDLSHKRYLCFCASIKQAEALGKDHAFTSKTPKSMALLEKFNNHQIDSLFVVGKLIEGQSLVDIHCGVIGQLGNSNRITVQELGRVFRSEHPVVYVPVFDNTKDEGFLYTVTNNIPAEYIKHYKF